jgi:hypothetical protein
MQQLPGAPGGAVRVQTAGWATTVVGLVASGGFVINYTLEQVPKICRKAADAAKAIRGLREEFRKSASDDKVCDHEGCSGNVCNNAES